MQAAEGWSGAGDVRRIAVAALLTLGGFTSMASAQPAAPMAGHEGGHAHHAAPGAHHAHAAPPVSGKALPPPDGVNVSECWVRAMPGRLPSAAYFVLSNQGPAAVKVQAVHTDAYGQVMMHTTRTVNGMATMAMLEDTTVPPGGRLVFEPGGHHVMLERAVHPPVVGATLPLAFHFEGGGVLTAVCEVRGPSGRRSAP